MGSRLFTRGRDTLACAVRGAPGVERSTRAPRVLALALCLLPALMAARTCAAQEFDGTLITQNTTWTRAKSPYVLSRSVAIEPGVTLTIEPGVIVKMGGATSIWVKGRLLAQGTASQKIIFTSQNDSTSNGTGPATPGYWSQIKVYCEGGPASGVFEHCLIRNGGDLSAYEGSLLTVKNCRVEHAQSYGIGLFCRDALVEDTEVAHCGAQGILVTHGTSNFQVIERSAAIRRCRFTNNAGPALHAYSGVIGFDCRENSGSGNGINGIVLQCTLLQDLTLVPNPGFPYVVVSNRFLESQTMVQPGATLTLSPGTIMKFADGDDAGVLYVKGRLIANGTPDRRILFTSLRDDTGGDTNGDGSATRPARGDWQGLRVGHPARSGSPAVDGVAELSWCDVRFGGKNSVGNLHLATPGSRLFACACDLTDAAYAAVYGGGSSLVRVKNSILERNVYGARQIGTANLDARYCWWGHPSGPYDPSDDRATGGDYNPTGQGDPVTDKVLYRSWLTSPGYGQTGGLNPSSGQSGSNVNEIIAGDPITITVTDPDVNENPAVRETIPVMVVSDGGDRLTAILTETGPNTGEFRGTVQTLWGAPNLGDETLQVVGGNLITVTYRDENNAQGLPQDVTHTISVRIGHTADLSLSARQIRAGDTVTITIVDKDLDESPDTDLFPLAITGPGNKQVIVLMQETEAPGVFTGELKTAFGLTPNPADDALQVKGDDRIAITYVDALDSTGKPNQPITTDISIMNGQDGILTLPAALTSSGGVLVTLHDADADPEHVSVLVTNTATGETETLQLVETDTHSGVFDAVLPTQFGESAGTSGDGRLILKGGDVVSVTYTDAIGNNGRPDVAIVKTTTVARGHTGVASVATDPIIAGDPIPVTVADADLAGRATVTVTATSPLGDVAQVTLARDPTDPSRFRGVVPTRWSDGTATNQSDEIVEVKGGQTITVTYVDAIDDDGRNDVPHTFQVPVKSGHNLEFKVTPEAIIAGQTFHILVADKDLAGLSSVTLPIQINGGAQVSLAVPVTGTPGRFEMEVATTFSREGSGWDGHQLRVKGGDTLDLAFTDALDGEGRPGVECGAILHVRSGADGSLSAPATIRANQGLELTVVDADASRNESAPDTVTVVVTNPDRLDAVTVQLVETGNHTGVFQAIVPTAFGDAIPDNQVLEVKGNDTLRALYVDALTADGEPNVDRRTETRVAVGTTATMDVQIPGVIRPGQSIPICIANPDANQDKEVAEKIKVTVRTFHQGVLADVEEFELEETGPDTGIFCGNIPTVFSVTPTPHNGILEVKGGDTITITYIDPLGSDGQVDQPQETQIEVKAGATGSLEILSGTSILAGQPITIRLIDHDLNDAEAPTVTFTTSGGDHRTATLLPTDTPGLFEVTVPTQRNPTPDTSDDTLQVVGGQTVTVTYVDAYDEIGFPDQPRSATITVRSGAAGTLAATEALLPGQKLQLAVTDADQNGDPRVKDTVTVTVTNPETGETEVVTLEETGIDTGIFQGELATRFDRTGGTPNDGLLAVKPGVSLHSTYEDTTEDGSTVLREATTAVTGAQVEHTFPAGRSLIAIPAELLGPGVGDVLRIDGKERQLAAYDPTRGAYELFTPGGPNTIAGAFQPKVGYFVKLNEAPANAMREFGTTLPQDLSEHRVPLKPGWNLIGSPFLTDTGWNRDLVKVAASGVVKSIRQAALEGSVVDYLWGLENGQYKLIADLDMNLPGSSRTLRAWHGYWLLSAVNAELILPAPSALASVRSVARAAEEGSWAFMLTASRGSAKDTAVVGTRGAAGVAAIRIAKAPTLPGGDAVSLSIVGDGAATGPGLAYDVRTAAATGAGTSYRLRVEAGASDEPVVLTWSDLRDVPARVRLLLVNEATGERRYLRTTSSVQVATTTGAPQFFRVVAEPAGDGLRVMGLNSAPGRTGGVAVTYSLSTSAQVELTVLSLTGKPIRHLPQAAVSVQGVNHTTWDGRDASGRAVPAGTYLMELTARTDIGEVAKTAVPVVMR